MPSLGGVRFVDWVDFWEPEALRPPAAEAEPAALAPAEAWVSSVRVCYSSAIVRVVEVVSPAGCDQNLNSKFVVEDSKRGEKREKRWNQKLRATGS